MTQILKNECENTELQAPPLGHELPEDGLRPVGHCVPTSCSGAAYNRSPMKNEWSRKWTPALAFKPLDVDYAFLRTVEGDRCCVTHFKNLVHFLTGMLIML